MRSCTHPASRSELLWGSNRAHTKTLLSTLALVILLLMALPGRASAQDSWFGPDKFLHFMGAFLATSVSYTVASSAWDMDHDRARMVGAATGVALSLAKELYDSLSGRGHASGKDLFWDGIGIGAGMAMINLMKPSPSLNAVDTILSRPTLPSLWR